MTAGHREHPHPTPEEDPMPETTRRVNVTLTFATDVEADRVMLNVAQNLPDEQSAVLESMSVHDFDLAEDGEDAPSICLVLGVGGVRWCDAGAAEVIGRGVRGVVVELPVTADYRGEVTRVTRRLPEPNDLAPEEADREG